MKCANIFPATSGLIAFRISRHSPLTAKLGRALHLIAIHINYMALCGLVVTALCLAFQNRIPRKKWPTQFNHFPIFYSKFPMAQWRMKNLQIVQNIRKRVCRIIGIASWMAVQKTYVGIYFAVFYGAVTSATI